jgi:hypothetical protein
LKARSCASAASDCSTLAGRRATGKTNTQYTGRDL